MKIKFKLGFAAAGLLLIAIVMFLTTWWMTSKQKDDGLIINLAGRQRMLTQKMTKEILSQKIEGIQRSTKETVRRIQQITQITNDVEDAVSTIATAVEEQSAMTGEIAGNAAQAASGITEVVENIDHSSTMSGEISEVVNDISQSKAPSSSAIWPSASKRCATSLPSDGAVPCSIFHSLSVGVLRNEIISAARHRLFRLGCWRLHPSPRL